VYPKIISKAVQIFLKELKEECTNISFGRLFHSERVFGKSEYWWALVLNLGKIKVGLSLDLDLRKWSGRNTGAAGKSVRLFTIL